MRRTCEYYYWGDFKTEVLEYMFPNADRIELKEEGNYDFTVVVYDEDGEFQGMFCGNIETATEEEIWMGL